MPFFSNLFKPKDARARKGAANDTGAVAPAKPRWEESWQRKTVTPDEVEILVHECTQEMKSRAMDMPFLLLPFRPGSDPVGSKSFIRNYFRMQYENPPHYDNSVKIRSELRLMEPLVLCSIIKWCWSRLVGGVVTWEVYELFKTGELDASYDSHAFTTFIPISAESKARRNVIFDFFDLFAAIAARGKTNGLGGRKLSRMAGWWAFEHVDSGEGFMGGYQSWKKAANATSHMFFAYLRSLSPDAGTDVGGVLSLPRSLQALVHQTEYPPEEPSLIFKSTPRVLMVVNSVSPTPFALLRRAKHFEFRDDDSTLHQFSEYNDPVDALHDECKRVLNRLSAVNDSTDAQDGIKTSAPQEGSWGRFEDMGFSTISSDLATPGDLATGNVVHGSRYHAASGFDNMGRPVTPSWADFLSTGFPDDKKNPHVLLSPDQQLPHIARAPRAHSSQSHVRNGDQDLDPGELTAVNYFELDETFWWVWMTSLAGEETAERKAVFGRCALIETVFHTHPWLVIEEQIKGASPGQDEGLYIAEKKSRFTFGSRSKLTRRKTEKKKKQSMISEVPDRHTKETLSSRIDPDKEDKVRAAARQLAVGQSSIDVTRRENINTETDMNKRSSVMTLQPIIVTEASQAMKWTKAYDNKPSNANIREAYLQNPDAGRGYDVSTEKLPVSDDTGHIAKPHNVTSPPLSGVYSERDLPSLPQEAFEQDRVAAPPSPPVTPPDVPKLQEPEEHVEHTPVHQDVRPHHRREKDHTPRMDSLQPVTSQDNSKPVKKGGFMKLFSRRDKNRQSAVGRAAGPRTDVSQPMPVNTSYQHSAELEGDSPISETVPDHSHTVKHDSATLDALEGNQRYEREAEQEPEVNYEPTYTEPVDDIRYSVQNPHRFDQGPLEDQPAFIVQESPRPSSEFPKQHTTRIAAMLDPQMQHAGAMKAAPYDGEATIVPITPVQHTLPTQHAAPVSAAPPVPVAEERPYLEDEHVSAHTGPAEVPELDSQIPALAAVQTEEPMARAPPAVPTASSLDRWAQIRKNAADRAQRLADEQAVQKQQQAEIYSSQTGRNRSQSNRTDGDDADTSGEETIESRVARIKARVAELTGNMDTTNGGPAGRY